MITTIVSTNTKVQTKLSNRDYSNQLTLMSKEELKREYESILSLELITHDDIFFFYHKRRLRVTKEAENRGSKILKFVTNPN